MASPFALDPQILAQLAAAGFRPPPPMQMAPLNLNAQVPGLGLGPAPAGDGTGQMLGSGISGLGSALKMMGGAGGGSSVPQGVADWGAAQNPFGIGVNGMGGLADSAKGAYGTGGMGGGDFLSWLGGLFGGGAGGGAAGGAAGASADGIMGLIPW